MLLRLAAALTGIAVLSAAIAWMNATLPLAVPAIVAVAGDAAAGNYWIARDPFS
jgi:hypothetical protein